MGGSTTKTSSNSNSMLGVAGNQSGTSNNATTSQDLSTNTGANSNVFNNTSQNTSNTSNTGTNQSTNQGQNYNVSGSWIPEEQRARGESISRGAFSQYTGDSGQVTTRPYSYGAYEQVGKDTTGQLNSYHSQAGKNFTGAGSSYQPYFQQGTATAETTAASNQAVGPNFNSQSLSQFSDPYKDAVLDNGLRRMDEGYDKQRAQLDDRAAGTGGAFGGTRNAVEQSENTKNYNLARGDYVDKVNSDAFKAATDQFNTNFAQTNTAAAQNFGQGMTTADFLTKMGQNTQGAQIAAGQAQLGLGNTVTAQENAQKQNAYNLGYQNDINQPLDIAERLAALNNAQKTNQMNTSFGGQTGTQTGTSTNTGTETSTGLQSGTSTGTSSNTSTGTSTGTSVGNTSAQNTGLTVGNEVATGKSKESGGWLGPALNAAGSMMMSDKRSKTDVDETDPEEILGAFAKLTPKSYMYKDEVVTDYPDLARPGRHTGVMAQDAEGAFGRALGPEVDGMKTLELSDLVGNLMAAVHGLEKRTRSLKERSQ